MRRFFVLITLAILVFWAVRAMHLRAARHAWPPARWHEPRRWHDGPAGRDFAAEARRQTQEALAEARRALDAARHEVRQAWRAARAEIRQAWHEVLAPDGVPCPVPPPPPDPPAPPREEADGLPVPIVPGTRVIEAEARPPAPPVARPSSRPWTELTSRMPVPPAWTRTVTGLISATGERARNDARRALRDAVLEWLDPEVPRSWTPPARLLDAMILETRITPVVKDYGTLYVAELTANFSPERRAAMVEAYNRELVRHRLATLGGALAFVLICLAAISGYIRADEATKGYYTNRLRMLAAAGVGAAGAIIYNMVA